ncbi:MAG: alpha/beta hydrolase [Desulfatibacillaceae bacterium]
MKNVSESGRKKAGPKKSPLALRLLAREHKYSIHAQRFVLDSFCTLMWSPSGTRYRNTRIAGVPGRWVLGHQEGAQRLLILLHGGGYMTGSSRSHRSLAANLCRHVGALGLVPDYRLAPEYPYPAALEDVLRVYRSLLAAGVPAGSIVLAGDSAGGGLALCLMHAARDAGLPLPAAAFLLSPWCDLTDVYRPLRLVRGGARRDFAHWIVAYLRDMYAAGHDPRHPYMSPLHGEFYGFPPMHVAVGRQEVLYRDAAEVVRKASRAGVYATLSDYRGPIHVAPFLAPVSGWAAHHLKKGARFLREHCPGE